MYEKINKIIDMQNKIKEMMTDDYESFFAAILSTEENIKINMNYYVKAAGIYIEYINNDNIPLLNENILNKVRGNNQYD